MRIRLELNDKEFNLKEILDDEYQDLSWAFARRGGCGEFSFRLPRKRFEEKSITGEQNIKIYYRNPATNTHDLWYQGLIVNKFPGVRGLSETIEISGHGYQIQLGRPYINNVTYTAQEASVIIKDILDNYVLPYTDITYDAGDIDATSFTFDSIQFNETPQSAIDKIASTVGGIEYGVDKNRKFYFKTASTSIGFRFLQGKHIVNFQDNQDFGEIINQIIVQGAQVGGTYFTFGPYDDTLSQAKYNLRTRVKQNSSVTTSSVAEQLANATLEEFKEVIRKASCELVNFEAQLESTVPIPLFSEISRKVKYGQKKYGTFLYSGIVGRQVNRINYSVTNNNSLRVSVDLGQLRPSIAEQISQLEYQLEQTRSAAL
jgi:hypothetical protein